MLDVDGGQFEIDTDFRSALRVMLAFEDNSLTMLEKQAVLLSNVFIKVPRNGQAAVEQAGWYLNGGREYEADAETGPRLYSFAKDAELIYAAFRQTHGIDLTMAKLHWWQFLALFMDLGQDTTFCQLIGLRKRVKTGKASKEERQEAQEMGDAFDVPDLDDRTLEEREKEREFLRLVGG